MLKRKDLPPLTVKTSDNSLICNHKDKEVRILLLLILISTLFTSYSQNNSLVINNNAYIVINGGTSAAPIYTVIDQPNALGIVASGTGGNIISEGEYNYVKWNVSNTTGTYTVPFTTGVGAGESKIPLSMQITSAGSAGGNLLFSTYETTDMNLPWPSTVTHMTDALTGTINNSLNVIDRFWIIDGLSYATKPTSTLSFGYNADVSETGGTNTLAVGNLGAQRFNSSNSKWESWFIGGTPQNIWGADNGSTTVSNVSVPAANLFRAWTLVDKSSPLPVTLVFFNGECNDLSTTLTWQTASESNNDYFLLEKSMDGINYSYLSSISGAGNSNFLTNYTYEDFSNNSGITYYRITTVDFDGTYSDVFVTAVEGCSSASVNAYSLPERGQIIVNIESRINETLEFYLFDVSGRIVKQGKNLNVVNGMNQFTIDVNEIAFGVYNLLIKGVKTKKVTKLVLN